MRDGKPYSAIVHLAEDVKPFVAMANGLGQLGFSSPQIFEADIDEGLLIIEDFGGEFVVAGDPPAPIEDRYAAAVDMLVALHGQHLPEVLPVAPHVQHKLPRYDLDAMLMEAELLLDWYLPLAGRQDFRRGAHRLYGDVARGAANRDRDRPHLGAAGLPFAEPDVAAGPRRRRQDRPAGFPGRGARTRRLRSRLAAAGRARRRAGTMEVSLLGRYVQKRREAHPDFDFPAFIKTYATMAAQRASKILGIFARLNGAMTSRNTCVTSRGYGRICSAR